MRLDRCWCSSLVIVGLVDVVVTTPSISSALDGTAFAATLRFLAGGIV